VGKQCHRLSAAHRRWQNKPVIVRLGWISASRSDKEFQVFSRWKSLYIRQQLFAAEAWPMAGEIMKRQAAYRLICAFSMNDSVKQRPLFFRDPALGNFKRS
jgi:hypothetical protein